MSNLKNMKRFNKSIIVLSLGLALSACGGSDKKVVDIIEEVINSAPTISSTAVTTVESGTAYSYSLVAADADGDTLTMSATGLPAWLTFDSATGILSGTPAETDAGDTAITLTVSDGTDDITQSFTVSVTVPVPANIAAVITSTAVTSATVGQAYTYTLVATDADSDTLTMSATIPGALSWLTFDGATGILSGTPASGDVAATEITLNVNDGTDDTVQTFTITVADVVVVGPEPALVVYEEDANPLWAAWDCCGGTTPVIITDDADHGQVTQFTIIGETVVGFNARDAVDGVAFATPTGTTLEFDIKVTAMPTAGVTDWKLKLEDSGDGAVEVNLHESAEGAVPVLDTWMHYTFNVADLGLTDVDLIMMFPSWGTGDGAEFSVDNVVFNTDDTPPPPETPALVVYEEDANPLWPAWDCCGDTTPVIITDDADHGQVTQFNIVGETVVGFNARDAVDGVAFDTPVGTTLEFDIKVTAMPTAGVTDWKLKLEDSGEGWAEVNLHESAEGAVPVLDTWMHYTFNVAGLGLSDVDLIMMFPAWGAGDGAEFSVDNVVFNFDENVVVSTPGDSGDGATTTTAAGIDFEGPQLTWGSFDTNKVQYVDNPDTTGINASSTVALLNVLQNDGEWAGARTEGIDTFALDASNCTVKLDVYRDTIGEMHVKFEKQNGDGWGSAGTVIVSNTVVNEWETLTFDTCAWIGHAETGVIDGFAIHADRTNTRAQDTMNYFDNIMFSAQEVVTTPGPTDGAPVPTVAEADVISVFSDTYTAVADVNTNPDWSQSTVTTEVDIAGNTTLKMAGLNYQGIEFSVQDLSGKASLHLDYWTADSTTFEVFLISSGTETSYTITTTQNGWQSVDIPLSTYTANGDLTKAFQFKFVGSGTIFLDNLYFN